ncbi:MAG: hypothetical protein GWN71_34875, partial [Gammaproteobacteria bacterium]|nr:hypothetical protein [Gemmatimonadota bacterium]NIT66407.1 hypothetical protein [Gemmatimonadota bacterium]NIU78554.1 hypothetical protein [Gammaproteobacteria bacterium]NIW74829.1 hypothetical protein [Gemmatimonadota bacterium]NIY34984.1 hypothetical protein [Gemmatimonadota bacterium]
MRQHHTTLGGIVRRATLLLVVAGALSACGDNLFETGNPPKLNEFTATAETVVEGDTLLF